MSRTYRNRPTGFIEYLKKALKEELVKDTFKPSMLTHDWIQHRISTYRTDSFHISRLSLPNFNLKVVKEDLDRWYENEKRKNLKSKPNLKLLREQLNEETS